MLFNSLQYAIFLPIIFITYWVIPNRYRWILLLIASYYFYMSWNPKYVALILGTTLISYLAALMIERADGKKKKQIILAIAVFICLGVLFVFKYFNFAIESLCSLFSCFSIELHPTTLKLLLPVGISFYTFQTVSYVIDVYRGDVKAEYHFGYYATFISFFPQLVAGPIERTSNLLPQIKEKQCFKYDTAMYGAELILLGLYKKIAVADIVSVYVDNGFNNLKTCTNFDLLLISLLFTIQIYCDFSGYSDIAIGSAKLLGIDLMYNFKSPYFSTSLKEFWSRWHISLSTWFRDYVYIPLGGNRCSKIRCDLNLFITFLISGLWHGANLTFLVWGGLHGALLIIEKRIKFSRWIINKCIKLIIVFILCNFLWIIFRANNLNDVSVYFNQLLNNLFSINSYIHTNIGLGKFKLMYILFVLIIIVIIDYHSLYNDFLLKINKYPYLLRLFLGWVLLAFIVFGIAFSSGDNQFVYFQF